MKLSTENKIMDLENRFVVVGGGGGVGGWQTIAFGMDQQ